MLTGLAVAASPLPGAVLGLTVLGFSQAVQAMQALRSRASIVCLSAACALSAAAALTVACRTEGGALLYLLCALWVLRCTVLLVRLPGGLAWRRAACAGLWLACAGLSLWRCPRFGWLIALGSAADHLLACLILELPSDPAPVRLAAERFHQSKTGRVTLRLITSLLCAAILALTLCTRAALLPAWSALAAVLLSVLAAVCAAWLCARHNASCPADPTHQLLLGLALAFLGALLAKNGLLPILVAGMILCGAGFGVCWAGSRRLVDALRLAARFLLADDAVWDRLLCALIQFGVATGAALGAVVLAALALGAAPALGGTAAALGCFIAFLVLCDFPISQRYFDKLGRCLAAEDAGQPQPELRAQLTEWLNGKHRQPLIIQGLVAVLHRFFKLTVIGRNTVDINEANPPIFLCNHGDLYGPIAAYLTVPTYVRPWSISTITDDHQTAFDYLYKYDWEPKTFLPVWLRRTCAHAVASFGLWGTGSLEAIPVYRDHPVQLRKTFRRSVDALAAGDALLIFPENPNAAGQDHGYETEGLGELFSGFAMIAQAYYSRTGKRCRFIPMFAHQPSRTVAFGEEIVFDPDNNPAEERQRISDEASARMLALYHLLDNAWSARQH